MELESAKNEAISASGWCSLPWTHLFVAPTGQIKPCCRFKGSSASRSINIAEQGLSKAFWGQDWQQLREQMRSGQRVEGCLRCHEEERAGKGLSLRQNYNRRIHELEPEIDLDRPRLRFLELGLSNLCNLKCRMCDSRYSVLWRDDERTLFGRALQEEFVKETDWEQFDGLWPELRHIKFTGGEPLLISGHLEFLRRLAEHGEPSRVRLNYSTNATVLPTAETLLLWSQFQEVEIALSVDGVGALNDYIRSGSQFAKVEKVVLEFLNQARNCSNLRIGLRPTISIYNIRGLVALVDWWINLTKDSQLPPERFWTSLTHLSFPSWLSITSIPLEAKTQIIQELEAELTRFSPRVRRQIESLLRHMASRDDSSRWGEFLQMTRRLDELRDEVRPPEMNWIRSLDL